MIKPLTKTDLRAQVGDQLKDLIISGNLKPGDELKEVPLAEALGVSRTPVREALQVLHSENFIVENSGRGYRVPEMTAKEAKEIYRLMGLIEAELVKTQAHFSDETLTKLKTINKNLQSGDVSHRKKISLDREFHQTLIQGSDNQTAKSLLDRIRQKSLCYEFLNYQEAGHLETSGLEHEEVVSLLGRGDNTKAAQKILNHWEKSAARLIEIFS